MKILGAIMSPALGEGGQAKWLQSVTRGKGGQSSQKVMSPLQKIRFSNRIRRTLKVVMTQFHLLFNVAFRVDNKVWVESMHIIADMRSKICIKGRLIISSKFFTIWVLTRGEGVQGKRWQSLTTGDSGQNLLVGRWHIFEWPLTDVQIKGKVGW